MGLVIDEANDPQISHGDAPCSVSQYEVTRFPSEPETHPIPHLYSTNESTNKAACEVEGIHASEDPSPFNAVPIPITEISVQPTSLIKADKTKQPHAMSLQLDVLEKILRDMQAESREAKHLRENQAEPAERQKPIKFQDAVGRKFSFPFHLANTWEVSQHCS